MLNNGMEITKEIQKKFSKDYFFIKGKINLDSEYFIKKIKEGCSKDNNLNFRTNIKGLMTDFHCFDKDPKFLEIVNQFIDYIDNNIELPKYRLQDSWGMEVRQNEKTLFHTHSEAVWSGVVYLNSSNQELIFPEIDEKIKPEEGVFALFSPFLEHGCNRNTDKNSKFGLSFNMQQVKDW
jgi:hypothetical protein